MNITKFKGSNVHPSHIANNSGLPTNHYGELMEQGDVIGVLFDKNEKNEFYSLSFSRNGKSFGVAFNKIKFRKNMRFVVHLAFHFLIFFFIIFLI